MIKLEKRAAICLTLVAVLLAGLILYAVRFVRDGQSWALFYGNQGIYKGGILDSGDIYDINGELLASPADGVLTYNEDPEVRRATVHAVGDPGGNVGTSVMSMLGDKLIGYDLLNGTYRMNGKSPDVTLSLDAQVCKAAYEALEPYKAGCIGIYNYETGELLCMVSTPAFDPENPEGSEPDDATGMYINRFLSSTFPPGSTFKTLTSAAVIETVPDYEEFAFDCDGSTEIDGQDIQCFGVHGHVDFEGALVQSCNGAFGILADRVGAREMKNYVKKCGLTTSYNIDGIHTQKGSFDFPSADPYHLAWAGIGQHNDLVNPCAMMIYMSAIAQDGRGTVPRLIHKENASPKRTGRMIEASTAEKLQEMMKRDVTDSYGEWNFPGLDLYAKTGTAEVKDHEPTVWFTGFLKNPDAPYAFVCMIEEGGSSSYVAAPTANEALQAAVNR